MEAPTWLALTHLKYTQIIWLRSRLVRFIPSDLSWLQGGWNLTTGQVAGSFAFQAKCENGILSGFSNPTGFLQFHVMHVLALLTSSQPIIKQEPRGYRPRS